MESRLESLEDNFSALVNELTKQRQINQQQEETIDLLQLEIEALRDTTRDLEQELDNVRQQASSNNGM